MATLITNDGIMRVDDNYLMHWAKGSEAKNHKWIKRIWTGRGWKYQYKQASEKADSLNGKIARAEKLAKSFHERSNRNLYNSRINETKSKRARNHYNYERNHGRYSRDGYASHEYEKAAESNKETARYNRDAVTQNAKIAEDAKRQQASAIRAKNKAKSKSLKSRAKKFIKTVKKIKNGDFVIYSDKVTTQFSDEKRPTTLYIKDTYANGKKKYRYKERY